MKRRIKLHAADFQTLRGMAKQAVWLEHGGKAAGWQGQISHGFKPQAQMNAEGNGRTHWVGMPEWAQGFGMNRKQIRATLEKALAGKPLGDRQYRLIRSMLRELEQVDGSRTAECPF